MSESFFSQSQAKTLLGIPVSMPSMIRIISVLHFTAPKVRIILELKKFLA